MAYLGREAAKAPIVTADLPNDGVTLAKMTGGTDGQIITYDASGDPVAVGPGSDGEVLTSTGAGSPPAFEAAAGGGGIDSTHDSVAKAWINWEDLETEKDGYNVSSVTNNETGDNTVNFSITMSSTGDYAAFAHCYDGNHNAGFMVAHVGAKSATTIQVLVTALNNYDVGNENPSISLIVFGE